ncbi:MAG: hypothetical protein HY665_01335 [Chloroflexi bacterium]|nr:hypothetical protein [Chloroflexota bacterium]
MPAKKTLSLDARVARKIDENRGDKDSSEFISLLIDNYLQDDPKEPEHVTKEEFAQFQEGIKELLRNFLEFFVSYGLELGKKQTAERTIDDLNEKLQALGSRGTEQEYITREEFLQFQEGTRELLRNFLEFFISYAMELGKPAGKLKKLNQKLQALGTGDQYKDI